MARSASDLFLLDSELTTVTVASKAGACFAKWNMPMRSYRCV